MYHVLIKNEPHQSSSRSVLRPLLQPGPGSLVWSASGAHLNTTAAFTPAQTNRTKWGNVLKFDSTKLNKVGVKALSESLAKPCGADRLGRCEHSYELGCRPKQQEQDLFEEEVSVWLKDNSGSVPLWYELDPTSICSKCRRILHSSLYFVHKQLAVHRDTKNGELTWSSNEIYCLLGLLISQTTGWAEAQNVCALTMRSKINSVKTNLHFCVDNALTFNSPRVCVYIYSV